MKLEVGKTYVNRIGELVEIVDNSNYTTEDYPFAGSDGGIYTKNGFYYYGNDPVDYDLISEYQPTKALTLEQIQDMHAEATRGYCIEFDHYLKAVSDTEFKYGVGVNNAS